MWTFNTSTPNELKAPICTLFNSSYMLPFPYFMTLSLQIWYGSLVSQRFTVWVGGMSWEVNSYYLYLQNCLPLDALVDKLPEKLSLLTVKVQTQTSWDQLGDSTCDEDRPHSWGGSGFWDHGIFLDLRDKEKLLRPKCPGSRNVPFSVLCVCENELIFEKASISVSHWLNACVCRPTIMWWKKRSPLNSLKMDLNWLNEFESSEHL